MQDTNYVPETIEKEAQQYWDDNQCFQIDENLNKEKFYCLAMFPYPSGTLHMGHIRNYTLPDVITRYQRMRGKNVLHPIGWDSFGMPAENAAIKHKIAPAQWTTQNIEIMKTQFKRMGFAYDWNRELSTFDPDYYKWEQWLFIKLFEQGLLYRKSAKVNWDPIDKTVLANEQVIDGKGWRSGAQVEQKEIHQWFLKITAYADELLQELDNLHDWPKQVVTMQKNWIGKSVGIEINFNLENNPTEQLVTFTTRPDTLMGVTALCISPDHTFAKNIAKTNVQAKEFIKEFNKTHHTTAGLDKLEKKGIFTGENAIHPITKQKIPIWMANFVLMEYGTGCIQSVPAHDERDYEFAKTYNLPIKEVIIPQNKQWDFQKHPYCKHGILINSGKFNNLESTDAIKNISNFIIDNKFGNKKTCYKLRDWLISRQRYWGTPIPIIYCKTCGTCPAPEDELPVLLPTDIELKENHSPLKSNAAFYNTICPKCGKDAHRETDTMDTFINSAWYYARFACYNQKKAMLDDRANYWLPVDYYVGGIEHAVLHLLYARFFHKIMRDNKLVNSNEPFKKLLTLGMVLNKGKKMSKSKGNTVSPDDLLDKYGVDAVRLFIIFASPPEQSLEWSESGLEGCHRFIKKLWDFANDNTVINIMNKAEHNDTKSDINWECANSKQKTINQEIHSIYKQINYDYERSQFNTVVSGGMKIFNIITKLYKEPTNIIDKHIIYQTYVNLLKLLSPIIPHITHCLWEKLGYSTHILDAEWLKLRTQDIALIENIEYVVQINGKTRGKVTISQTSNEKDMQDIVRNDPYLTKFIGQNKIKKSFIIKNRKIISIVT